MHSVDRHELACNSKCSGGGRVSSYSTITYFNWMGLLAVHSYRDSAAAAMADRDYINLLNPKAGFVST